MIATPLPPCQLEPSGYCPGCRRVHVGRALELSQDAGPLGVAYRQRQRQQVAKGLYGPGTELQAMFAESPEAALFTASACGCKEKAQQMNVWGVAGCLERREAIVAWFVAPCKAGQKDTALTSAARDVVGALVDEAIRRADAKCRAVPALKARAKEPRPARGPKRKAKGCCPEQIGA